MQSRRRSGSGCIVEDHSGPAWMLSGFSHVRCMQGHSIWRQPLKVTFLGEAGMDSGGVTREWFSSLSSAISRVSASVTRARRV